MVSNHPEGTFARLRYSLGGDRPSQTTHHAMSFAQIHGHKLDNKYTKGGISRMAPQELAFLLQSLPPILHIIDMMSLRSYSKGARGLSV